MATPIGEDVPLNPGDLVDVVYEVKETNQAILDFGISKVKAELAKDPRWHYQGFQWQEYEDPDFGGAVRLIVFTVQVADPSKVTGQDPPPMELAGFVGVLALIAAIGAAIVTVAWIINPGLIYRSYVIHQIVQNPNVSDEVKSQAIAAVSPAGVTANLADMGHSLVIVALLIGAIWLLAKSGLIEKARLAPVS